ncbi:MAG: hypothetical protein CMJ75_16930 [Planctomycetaceae bacterium]|nr:hypothetical protein [Planctomycetaceae bacterium]
MGDKRTRLLLVVLGAIGVLYAGDLTYQSWIESPRQDAERQKARLEKQIRETKLSLAKSKRVAADLEQLESQSLPWDLEVARSAYQAWLLQLVQRAKLQTPNVDSSEPVALSIGRRGRRGKPACHRLGFTLRTRGSLKQVVHFLFDFYRADHLHKIRSMNFNPVGRDRTLDLTLSIETLALGTALRENELSRGVSERLASATREEYQPLVRRNLFDSGRGAETAKKIQFTAVTRNRDGTSQAWFRIAPSGKTQILSAGQPLNCPGLEVRVLEVLPAATILSLDGERIRVRIGQRLVEGTSERARLAHQND